MMQAIEREQIPKSRNPAGGQPSGGICSTSTKNYSKPNGNNQLSFSDVRIAAYGQWQYIHTTLGIKIISTDYRKHTACPGCGGKDRFRVMADYGNTGKWFCGGGGDQQSGDGFSLLGHVFGWTPQEQLKAVADVLGLSKMGDSERAKIKEVAEKQSAQIAKVVELKKAEAYRSHCKRELAEDLLDAMKHHDYLQDKANKAGSFDIIQDTETEIAILKAIYKIYADRAKEVNHA